MSCPRRVLIVDDNHSIHEDFKKILMTDVSDKNHVALDQLETQLFAIDNSPPSNPIQEENIPKYQIDSAYQGEEALKKIRQAEMEHFPYSLIFMDIRMPPGWNGIETIEYIWKEFPDKEIVIASAYSDFSWNDILSRLKKSDHLLFLRKPFESLEVQHMALALTEKHALAKKIKDHISNLEEEVSSRTEELYRQQEISLKSEKLASLGLLAAGIAHEINTPLSTIALTASFIREEIEQTTNLSLINGHIDLIEKTVMRIGHITHSLKAYARSNTDHIEYAKVCLTEMVNQVQILCSYKLKASEVTLDCTNIPPLTVLCRQAHIEQVLINLVANACDAVMPLQEKWIRVEAKKMDGGIEITVLNNGPLISTEIQSKLFDPFFTTKSLDKGTGLGLSVSKGLVEAHGGRIFLDNNSDVTRFVVWLPTCPLVK